MEKSAKIFVAGHNGLVGSALVRKLKEKAYRFHSELDLNNQPAVEHFFVREKPQHVFLAAAKVGGIHANNTFPADLLQYWLRYVINYVNLMV
ncbi:MAG: NAD-dependent epimerase/dehydratase family protein [Chitinispirillaceae bacterium]|nr:NAD-dependent epimerase/dehydratase family protein [Chitinispirillaceae bacterium]